MTQRILIEILLFLMPFGLFLVYRLGSKEVSVRDRWPLKVLASTGFAIAVVGLLIWPLLEESNKGLCTRAARYEKGVTIPAEKVDCKAGGLPAGTDVTAATPGEVLPPEPSPLAPDVPLPTAPSTAPNGGLNPG
jgi:hypothetical protein